MLANEKKMVIPAPDNNCTVESQRLSLYMNHGKESQNGIKCFPCLLVITSTVTIFNGLLVLWRHKEFRSRDLGIDNGGMIRKILIPGSRELWS